MNEQQCNSCRQKLTYLGQLGLRAGGMNGGWEMVFGVFSDLGESVIYLDTYRCESCGRIEFFDHDFSLPGE